MFLIASALFCLPFAAISSQVGLDRWNDSAGMVDWNSREDGIGNSWNSTALFKSLPTDPFLVGPASAMSSFASYANINLDGRKEVTVSGAPGETVTLDLQNFVLSDRSALTLEGTATTTFLINVTERFSLSGTSQIVLSSGVRWDHVFFNTLGSGSVVSLSGRATLRGMLTANLRTVKMYGHSTVYGTVVANRLVVGRAALIVPPPIISP